MTQPSIGLIAVGTPWFDTAAATRNVLDTRRALEDRYRVTGPRELVLTREQLDAAIAEFREANVAALVLQPGTFPDGDAPARIAQALGAPIVVHALPEPALDTGVPLNSLCGANLITYTLSALEHPHAFVFGSPADAAAVAELRAALDGFAALHDLKGTTLGLYGYRAPGFYPCAFDELLIRKTFGISVEHVDLHEIFEAFRTADRRPAPHEHYPTLDGGTLGDDAVASMERYYDALTRVVTERGHSAIAIKDWPEIEHFDASIPGGFWPALGWIQDDGVDLAPEGDVNGAVTMALLHRLSPLPPFFADISAWDDPTSSLTLWHYGGATSLARDQVRFGPEGREVQFTLRPGRATLARLGLHRGRFRALTIDVEVLDEELTLRRAAARVRTLNAPAGRVVRALLDDGWEHHYSLAYGDVTGAIAAIARATGIEHTRL